MVQGRSMRTAIAEDAVAFAIIPDRRSGACSVNSERCAGFAVQMRPSMAGISSGAFERGFE